LYNGIASYINMLGESHSENESE